MAKREFSSTLKNLKFMQRATKKEEKPKEEEVKLQPDDVFGSSAALRKKCIVIMEGNPHPGGVKGRMSFQNFNPSIDVSWKRVGSGVDWQLVLRWPLKEHEETECYELLAFLKEVTVHCRNQDCFLWRTTSGKFTVKDNEHPSEYTNRDSPHNDPEVDNKRKLPEVETDNSHPQNSQRYSSSDGDGRPSLQNNRKNSYKQQKREKLDWNVLRPTKAQARRDSS
ncbi:hypothetical protein Taro_047290 [Colocasia esculenta]|uniref:Uncharacterized protein n=1 Tax=Colocasia esculenta TaxID=4460 RepID=A0A843X3N0_COLES|nr:hypothetical protein [Colocasia esculenta]